MLTFLSSVYITNITLVFFLEDRLYTHKKFRLFLSRSVKMLEDLWCG